MRKTFAGFSFGCRVNQAEMEELNRQLSVIGYQYSQNHPAIYLVNTCAVTAKAEREARQYINQIRRKCPKTKIIITGCAATKWIMERKRIPGVEQIIGNSEKEHLANLINSNLKSQMSQPKADQPRAENLHLKTKNLQNYCKAIKTRPARWPVNKDSPGVKESVIMDKYLSCGRMLVKIQDGCQRFCSYCIVPYLRGKPKSVPIAQLVKIINDRTDESVGKQKALKTPRGWPANKDSPEVEAFVKIKEVILTAINTEAFGLDSGETFNDLTREILNKTKIERLSFGSIHPWSINNEFIKFYKQIASDQRFIDFFHIPLQSGSNKILNLMKRGYTREEFMEKLNIINLINPLAFIGTDIIVGFLDETDHDFEDTYNFLAASPISKFHIFRFSKREKTAAYFMAKRIKEPSPQKKVARAKILSELGHKKYQQFLAKHLNKTFPALFLSRDKNSLQWALLTNQIPVIVDTDKELTREIKNVKVKNIKEDKLFGVIS